MNTKVLFAADISLKSPQLILLAIDAYMVSGKKQAKKFNIGLVIILGIMATNLEIYSNKIIVFDHYLRDYQIQIIKTSRI